MAAYATLRAIRREAGLQHLFQDKPLDPSADGTRTKFYVSHKPIVDRIGANDVDTTDVTVYVNGEAVTVTAINVTSGELTLAVAPPEGASVTADWAASPADDDLVTEKLEEAQEWIDGELGRVELVVPDTVPKSIRKIARFYAAGLLLITDYGFQVDNQNPAKEGYRKIEQAEKWMKGYVGELQANLASADISAEEGLDLFSTQDSSGNTVPVDGDFRTGQSLDGQSADEEFMQG